MRQSSPLLLISMVLVLFFTSCIGKQSQSVVEKTIKTVNRASATSNLWKNVTTSTADSSKWQAYGANIITNISNFTKITIKNNDKGAYLFLDKIASSLRSVDNKNYKITFSAYIINGNTKSLIEVRNISTWNDITLNITDNFTEYVIKRPNIKQNRAFIRFTNLPIGSIIYVSNDIKIEQMIDRDYVQPFNKSFKGGTLDMNRLRPLSEVQQWFSDLNDAGAKYVRIQANPKAGMNGFVKVSYLADVVSRFNATYLPLVRRYRMKVIFAMESIPYDTPKCDNRMNPEFWKNSRCIQNFRDTAHYITNAFKDISEVFALQFMSEPLASYGRPKNWDSLSLELINIVRQYTTEKFIVWSNGPGGLSRYDTVVPFRDDRIIYNFHNFGPHEYTHQGTSNKYLLNISYPGSKIMTKNINSIVSFRNRNNNIPIMCGSYSVANWISDGDIWQSDFINLLELNNISSIQFVTGAYRGWDYRYIGTNDGTSMTFTYDKTSTNKLWTILSNYWKD